VAQNTDEQYLHLGATSRSMGVFVGGVLYTPSAWVMGLGSPVARVRAGAEVCASPRLAILVHLFYGEVN
jgi:hypothetical protein